MRKTEFVTELMKERKIPRKEAALAATFVFSKIRNELLLGKEVHIEGVGKFIFKFLEPTTRNNNLTGQQITLPRRVHIRFYPYPSMQNAMNNCLLGDD